MAPILVVDDEALIRWFVSERLLQEGHAVVEAGDGATAREHFEGPLSLVLLDVKLPDDDGVSLLRHLRSHHPEVPVVMMSAHGDGALAELVRAEGARAFLAKPFDVEEMVRVVRAALE